jgi:hypothetical protein
LGSASEAVYVVPTGLGILTGPILQMCRACGAIGGMFRQGFFVQTL